MNKIISFPSPNYNDRPPGTEIDILVFHYTGMPKPAQALERMCDPDVKVSAHYLIDKDGQLFQLISEEKRAWHAGISSWRNNYNINDRSIGIELANPGHEFGYQKFPTRQIDTLIEIAKDIIKRHPVPARNIIGHSDIAPARKKDPGEFFDWHKLALKGIGYWPESLKTENINQINASNFKLALQKYGYDTTDLPATILAFQRHFLPTRCNSQPDQEMFKMLEILISNI
jgi:N-acetylmuramoyl-L-alanine amidase|nr:N-acetylmuramoyl-L-alanine amidase [Rhodospirillales bacterium]